MKRALSVLSIILIVLLSLAFAPQTNAESTPVRSRRIVSVMYDDSGSMTGDTWISANYAMQAFTAMLNKEDTLYISYMSENGPDDGIDDITRTIDLNNPQTEVDSIRSHNEQGWTPLNTLKNSFSALTGENDTNPNTEYWLVAFTDGDFNGVKTSEVTTLLKTYAETEMPNGTKAKIFFMTIPDGVHNIDEYTPSDSGMSNIDIRKAKSMSDVTENIFSVAAEISGRYRVTGNDLSMPDSKTITVSADLPLFNIGVLTQNSDVKVESITYNKEKSIPIKSDVSIKAPGKEILAVSDSDILSDEALNMQGRAVIAGQNNNTLPAGKYTISFSDSLNESDAAILLEPAVELRIQLFKDGSPVDDSYEVTENETGLSVHAALYEYGSNNEVLPSMMPDGVIFSITHSENGAEIESDDSLSLDTLTVTSGENTIIASASLPGFFNLTAEKSFVTETPVVVRIDAEVYPDGSERLSDSDGPEVVYLTDLEKNKTGIKFTLYEDEGKIDSSRAKQLLDSFNAGLSVDFNNHNTEILPDGSFLVYPTKSSIFYNPLIDWLFHHGTQKVSVDLNGAHAEGSLTFKLGNGWIIPLLMILVPLYLIWWFLFKKHFPRGTLLHLHGKYDEYDDAVYYKEDDSLRLSWFGATRRRNILLIVPKLIYLLFPIPSKVKFHGYTFTGQKTFFRRHDLQLAVKNVSGKSVSTSSRKPSGKYPDSKIDMDDKLYIKDATGNINKYDSFKLE